MRSPEAIAADVAPLLDLVRKRTGVDLGSYRADVVASRVAGRAAAAGCQDLEAYRLLLERDADEPGRLVSWVLLAVTSFFRDQQTFDHLASHVVPQLFSAHGRVRAWVVGAATGEEAWSMAMVLDAAAARHSGGTFEVIASDLDGDRIEEGRAGFYPTAAANDVPAALRERYLRVAGQRIEIAGELRRHVRFAQHDLMGPHLAPAEAIVASFELVSCRNVLLYFDDRLRRLGIERLAAVLASGGALLLGDAESVPPSASALRPWPGSPPGTPIYRKEDR